MKIITKMNRSDTPDSDSKEYVIGVCDDCSKVITSSDKYLKLYDSLFCETHTCMLSEIIEQVQLCVDQGHVIEFYKTLLQQEKALQMLRNEFVNTGDRKFISSE